MLYKRNLVFLKDELRAKAIATMLYANLFGVLTPYKPNIRLSKRALIIPSPILKLTPYEYEFKISYIYKYATKDLFEIHLHLGNKFSFCKITTPYRFHLGILLKG